MPSKKDIIFVSIQATLLVALFTDPFSFAQYVNKWTGLIGFLLCGSSVVFGLLAIIQLGTNLTPWPSPKSTSTLITSGTFAWARHPIYATIIGFAFGLALAFMSPWKFGITALLILLFYKKSDYEESMLRERYEDYAAYAKRVKRFGSLTIPEWW